MNSADRVKVGRCDETLLGKTKRMTFIAVSRSRWLAGAALFSLTAACASAPQAETGTTAPPTAGPGRSVSLPLPETGPITYEASGHAAMDAWRTDFSSRALAAGYDRSIVESVLTGISPIPLWLGSSFQVARTGIADQAEFSKPMWEYLRVPMSSSRINTGIAKLTANSAALDEIETRFGVDREAVVAIWGMETSYGALIGDYDAPNVLANMAVEGRRQSFAESEIFALMKILSRGEADRDDLIAGWAGAMGHTQFMPSTYLAYAADYDGDGKKDIWKNEADALASTANYLAKSGYTLGQPWGIEVLVPANFDYSLADGNERRMETWLQNGLTPIAGGNFKTGGANYAELWLPAGAQGPKFLLFNNFKAFKRYNNADTYALAVGLSGNAFNGKIGPVAAWPTHLQPLSVPEVEELQAALNAQGYDAGSVDGIPGRRTKTALQQFQKAKGLVADGYPTFEMLDLVKASAGSVGVAAAPSGGD